MREWEEVLRAADLTRAVLEAVCQRDGISLASDVEDGPARNYELALRLGIGHVFGLGEAP